MHTYKRLAGNKLYLISNSMKLAPGLYYTRFYFTTSLNIYSSKKETQNHIIGDIGKRILIAVW